MNLVLALLLLPGLLNGALQSQAGSPARQIEGTVVAYSPLSRLTIIVGSYQPSTKRSFQESFLLRLDHNYVDLKKGQLIQLKYDGETGSKPELPKELFEHNGHWTLRRRRTMAAQPHSRRCFITEWTANFIPICNTPLGPNHLNCRLRQ